jgi:PhnB protein
MSTTFKPSGYSAVSPYFVVHDAPAFISLLKNIFAAEDLRRYDRPDGTIMHAELRIEDSVIMISEASSAFPSNNLLMHVYVPDVHDTFQKALDAGCEAIENPVQKPGDPDIRGMFKDIAGNVWAVGTQVDTKT